MSPGASLRFSERAAFGAIVLRGHGTVETGTKYALRVESTSMFSDRDDVGGDEFFVAEGAAGKVSLFCESLEPMAVYQHFASASNPETGSLEMPEYTPFRELE